MASPYAFVTLLTSDSYLPGALTLAAALKDVHPTPPVHPEVEFQTVCLVTPESVDVSVIKLLRRAYNVVIGVEIIASEDNQGFRLLGRPDLRTVLTKLHVFRLTQFSKIIFLDSDVLPIRPLSHLFTLPHEFSAVPDVGWPDIFNSGVMVLSPGQEKFDALKALLESKGSWDGGDQGILNEWRGRDWNKLSFTYNTTPSAAYMYAPAYERFGTDITAIHFIGPNKPWSTLSYRPPGSGSTDSSTNQQSVYDYNSLIDRWFAVYDRHYRMQTLPPKPEFEVQKYTSAWDEGQGVATDLRSHAVPVIGALGLDDLRQIAVEGMSTSGASAVVSNIRPEGEGEYQSMPLEGRVDLMRPKKEEEPPEQDEVDEQPATPPAWHIDVPEGPPPRMETLPTPAPHEMPTAPHLRVLSLPPSTPSTPSAMAPHHHKQTLQLGIQNIKPALHQQQETSHPPQGAPIQLQEQETSLQPQEAPHQPQDSSHQPQEASQEPPKEQSRPASPPLFSWNPAVEPPPKTTPPVSAFPADTYFPNAWDHSAGKQPQSPLSPPAPPSGLFHPLPPPEIPEALQRQGHYRKVTGEASGATLSPDRAKVKPIFPWEELPRHLPGRVFPPSDSPPPGIFLPPSSPLRHEVPSTPERQIGHLVQTPSPLSGLPPTLNYANAWDVVPSIHKYASWLSRTPPSPPALLAPAFEDTRRRERRDSFKSWSERLEANSGDGDDEDSAYDDEEEEEAAQTVNEDGSRSKRRSLSSRSPAKMKKYKSFGVQTILPEMKSQGVQFPPVLPRPPGPLRLTSNGRRSWPPVSSTVTLQPVLARDVNLGLNSRAATSPSSSAPTKLASPPVVPSDTRSPRQSVYDTSPYQPPSSLEAPAVIQVAAQAVTPPPKEAVQTAQIPSSFHPMVSPTVTSPPSSLGPLSPPEGQPVSTPTRKGARVWDPARRVELVKRGSDEVLARFSKMGKWEKNAPARS